MLHPGMEIIRMIGVGQRMEALRRTQIGGRREALRREIRLRHAVRTFPRLKSNYHVS